MTAPNEQLRDGSLDWLATWLVLNHQREQRDIAAKTVVAMLPLWKLLRFRDLDRTQLDWIKAVLPIVQSGYRDSQLAAARFVADYRHARMPSAPDLPALTPQPGPVAAPLLDSQTDIAQQVDRILTAVTHDVRSELAQPTPELLRRGNTWVPDTFPASETAEVISDTPLDPARAAASLLGTGPGEVKKRMPAPEPVSMAAGQVKSAKVGCRIVTDGGRSVVQRAVELDHHAIGWARVLNTSPCSFCAILASRGAVYKRDSFKISDPQFEGEGVAKVHDGCRCGMRPVYSEAERWDPTATNLLEQWKTITKGVAGAEARRKFRNEFTPPPEPDIPQIDMHSLLVRRQRLLDEGLGLDSSQVTWMDAQIARFGGVINTDPNLSDLAERVRIRNRDNPGNARKRRKTNDGKPRQKTSAASLDRARQHIPALEKLAEELLARGYTADSPQVQKVRAQIARFRQALH